MKPKGPKRVIKLSAEQYDRLRPLYDKAIARLKNPPTFQEWLAKRRARSIDGDVSA